jgi:hypothetical protein
MKLETLFGFGTTAGSHLGQSGLIVFTSSMQLRYINQRGKELGEQISRSENTKRAYGLLPSAVTGLVEELQALIQMRAESNDRKKFQIRRVVGHPEQAIRLLGTNLRDADMQESYILVEMRQRPSLLKRV